MFLGPLMMLAFIAVIVVVVVLLLRGYGGDKSRARTSSESRADDILKERFARGEIDKEEYEERRRILRDSAAGAKSSFTSSPKADIGEFVLRAAGKGRKSPLGGYG